MTLVEFLLARIAEDEDVAKRAEPNQAPNQLRAMVTRGGSEPFLVIDSARVLAECEAKRQIVKRSAHASSGLAAGVINPASVATAIAWTDALRILAEVYADHPQFDPTWRP